MGRYRYLTFEDRKKIEKWYLRGDRVMDIASRLGYPHPTIYRELQRGCTGELDRNMRSSYSAETAQRLVQQNLKRRGKKQETRTGG